MRWKTEAMPTADAPAVRFAWWLSFAATLGLVVLLAFAHSAQAQSEAEGAIDPAAPTIAALLPDDLEDAEEEDEAGEEVAECEEEAAEEGESPEESECNEGEEGAESADSRPASPRAETQPCLLRSARVRAVVVTSQSKLRLTIHYSALSPTTAAVEYGLRGGKGSLRLGTARPKLAEHGVLHLSDRLSKAEVARSKTAKELTIRMRVPSAAKDCRSLEAQSRLKLR